MHKNLLIFFLCALAALLAFTGCNKEVTKTAETPASKAAKDAAGFMTELSELCEAAGDNCNKLGKDMVDSLAKNKESFTAAMKLLSNIDPESTDAEKYKDDLEKILTIMDSNSEFSKAMTKCKDNADVVKFSESFLSIIANSSKIAAEESAKDDALAADAPKAE